jgi:hypothetical protein
MSLRSWRQRFRRRPEPSEEEVGQITEGMESIRDDVPPPDPPPQEP